jgi:hypothetical protein
LLEARFLGRALLRSSWMAEEGGLEREAVRWGWVWGCYWASPDAWMLGFDSSVLSAIVWECGCGSDCGLWFRAGFGFSKVMGLRLS